MFKTNVAWSDTETHGAVHSGTTIFIGRVFFGAATRRLHYPCIHTRVKEAEEGKQDGKPIQWTCGRDIAQIFYLDGQFYLYVKTVTLVTGGHIWSHWSLSRTSTMMALMVITALWTVNHEYVLLLFLHARGSNVEVKMRCKET